MLDLCCEFGVVFINEKFMQSVEELKFVSVEQSSSLRVSMPELDVMFDDVFLKSFEIPVSANELIGGIGEAHEELSESADPQNIGLPAVWNLTVVGANCADSISEFGISFIIRKKLLERCFWYGFMEAVKRAMRGSAAKSYGR